MACDDPVPFGQLVGPVDKIVPEEGGGGFRAVHPQEGMVEARPRCLRDMEEVDEIALDLVLHREGLQEPGGKQSAQRGTRNGGDR